MKNVRVFPYQVDRLFRRSTVLRYVFLAIRFKHLRNTLFIKWQEFVHFATSCLIATSIAYDLKINFSCPVPRYIYIFLDEYIRPTFLDEFNAGRTLTGITFDIPCMVCTYGRIRMKVFAFPSYNDIYRSNQTDHRAAWP